MGILAPSSAPQCRNRQLKHGRSQDVAGFAPIGVRVRYHKLNPANWQREEAKRGYPVSNPTIAMGEAYSPRIRRRRQVSVPQRNRPQTYAAR